MSCNKKKTWIIGQLVLKMDFYFWKFLKDFIEPLSIEGFISIESLEPQLEKFPIYLKSYDIRLLISRYLIEDN